MSQKITIIVQNFTKCMNPPKGRVHSMLTDFPTEKSEILGAKLKKVDF